MAREVDESVLDDPDRLRQADPGGRLRALAAAGAIVRRTVTAAAEAGAGALAADGLPRAVILVGDSSATVLVAEAMVVFAGSGTPVPLVVHRMSGDGSGGGELPRWVGAADLLLAAGGSDAEMLGPVLAGLVAQAGHRGTRVAAVGPADSPLAAAAGSARGVFVEAPAPEPFWPAYAGLLCLLRETGLITAPDELLELMIERMDDRAVQARPAGESFLNPAKGLALQLAGAVPVVGAGSRAGELAARRFIDSLGELAGHPAVPFAPAYLDGALATAPGGDDIFRDRVQEPEPLRPHVVLLREEGRDPAVERMGELAAARGVRSSELVLEPGPDPVRFARAVAELDFVAAYLAILLGVDPSRSLRQNGFPTAGFQARRTSGER